MIPDKNFKMKRSIKCMIALMRGESREGRNQFKNMMINAQLHEEAAKRAALKSKDNGFGKTAKDPE
jgi:hypothetical protein